MARSFILNNKIRSKSKKGFTLIELSVVLVIIGLLALILIPNLSNFGKEDIKYFSRKLDGMFQYLYAEATIQRKNFYLNFDLTNNKYWVSTGKVNTEDNTVEMVKYSDEFIKSEYDIPEFVKLEDIDTIANGKVSEGKVVVTFYPQGFVDPVTFHLKDKNDNEITLLVLPLTGDLKFYEGYKEFSYTRQ